MKTDMPNETAATGEMLDSLDDFTRAYLECALWSSTDEDGNPLDDEYDIEDINLRALKESIDDCRDFQDDPQNAIDLEGVSREQAGHDFWLTRNRHGAGFWDRGLGEKGERLTKAAHVYGGVDLMPVGNGKVGF